MTNTERAIELFTNAVDERDNGGGEAMTGSRAKSKVTYGIDFKSGLTIITPNWEVMKQYIAGGDVTMVIVCESGEILYDARDGWDIVSE